MDVDRVSCVDFIDERNYTRDESDPEVGDKD